MVSWAGMLKKPFYGGRSWSFAGRTRIGGEEFYPLGQMLEHDKRHGWWLRNLDLYCDMLPPPMHV